MASTSSILGQYEANLNSQAGNDRIATDKDTFLKLLVAQLTHQDPLNPVEDKEFIAQLAQFTTVEELQNINAGVEQLNAAYLAQQATNASGLIGLEVLAGGDNIYLRNAAELTEDQYPGIYFTLPSASASGTFNVYATNSDGTIGKLMYSSTMPGYSSGTHGATWDGRDFSGNPMANGTYVINITAVDADGNNILVDTSSSGTVIGVKTEADGNHKLYLLDGRTVNFNDVELITVSSANSTTPKTVDELEKELATLTTAYNEASKTAELAAEAAEIAAAAGSEDAEELAALAEKLKKAAEEAKEKMDAAQKALDEAKAAA